MKKLKRLHPMIALAIAAALLVPLTACKGRKTRAELVTFVRAIEETRVVGDNLVVELGELKFEKPEDEPALVAQLDDMIKRIDIMLAPTKALKLQTEEVLSLRDNYLRSWESIRDALDLVSRVLKTKDKKLAMTMDEQLRARMSSYEQSVAEFEKNYKATMVKYGITSEDLGIVPPIAPVTPFPFTPAAPQAPQ